MVEAMPASGFGSTLFRERLVSSQNPRRQLPARVGASPGNALNRPAGAFYGKSASMERAVRDQVL